MIDFDTMVTQYLQLLEACSSDPDSSNCTSMLSDLLDTASISVPPSDYLEAVRDAYDIAATTKWPTLGGFARFISRSLSYSTTSGFSYGDLTLNGSLILDSASKQLLFGFSIDTQFVTTPSGIENSIESLYNQYFGDMTDSSSSFPPSLDVSGGTYDPLNLANELELSLNLTVVANGGLTFNDSSSTPFISLEVTELESAFG